MEHLPRFTATVFEEQPTRVRGERASISCRPGALMPKQGTFALTSKQLRGKSLIVVIKCTPIADAHKVSNEKPLTAF